MLKYLKIGVSTLALTAFVTAPVVTVVTIATADSAYANNGKGNGGGNGGGNKGGGNKGGGGDNSASKSGKGSGADKAHKGPKSKSANAGKTKNGKGLGRAVRDEFKSISRNLKKNGIGGLFKGQPKQRTAARTAKVSVKESVRPPNKSARFKDDLMHPSQLGKMNGLLNSSINAKLAHIANGQFTNGTGPVSLAAALAVADYKLGIAESAVATLDGLTEQEIMDAQKAVEGLTAQDIQDAEDLVAGGLVPDVVTQEDLNAAQATLDAQAIADAQDVLDQYPSDVNPIETAMKAIEIAEDDVLSTYKGTMTDDIEKALLGYTQDIEDEEVNYIGEVRQSLPDGDAVAAALATYEEKEAAKTAEGAQTEEDTATSAEGELAEEDAAMVEGEETPDQG